MIACQSLCRDVVEAVDLWENETVFGKFGRVWMCKVMLSLRELLLPMKGDIRCKDIAISNWMWFDEGIRGRTK